MNVSQQAHIQKNGAAGHYLYLESMCSSSYQLDLSETNICFLSHKTYLQFPNKLN